MCEVASYSQQAFLACLTFEHENEAEDGERHERMMSGLGKDRTLGVGMRKQEKTCLRW